MICQRPWAATQPRKLYGISHVKNDGGAGGAPADAPTAPWGALLAAAALGAACAWAAGSAAAAAWRREAASRLAATEQELQAWEVEAVSSKLWKQ